MIPTVERFAEIAALQRGRLEEVPYAVLLAALARGKRSAVLRLSRKPVEKQVFLLDGIAVDCRSNLVHETLGRFLVSVGKLDEAELQSVLADSLRREVPLGEILLERDLLDAEEIYRQLRQNLARKLLDPFTWTQGEFEIHDLGDDQDTTLEVRTPQLILTGILKLTPPKQVMEGIRPLLGLPLAVNPNPPWSSTNLRVGGVALRVLSAVRHQPQALDQLALTSGVPSDMLGRSVYALAVLGLVGDAGTMEGTPTGSTRTEVESTEVILHPPSGQPLNEDELEGLKRRVMEAFLSYRRKDSFDLLEVAEEADLAAIDRGYLRFARRFAPWVLEAQAPGELSEKATDLYLAGAMAYAELASTEQRGILLERRRNLRRNRKSKATQPQIATDLLDSTMQYRKGMEFLQSENYSRALEFLQFAADVDPQNALYRAEAAYCRYRLSPMQYGDRVFEELREAVRIDRNCGLAQYYLGLVEVDRKEWEEAEEHLRQAIKLMAPDRRPIEALKDLAVQRKRRRR